MNKKTITFRILITACLAVAGLVLNTTKAHASSFAEPCHQYPPVYSSGYNDSYSNTGTYNPLSYIPPSGSAITYVPSDSDNDTYANYSATGYRNTNYKYLDYGYAYPSTGNNYHNPYPTTGNNYYSTATYPETYPTTSTTSAPVYNPVEYPTYPPTGTTSYDYTNTNSNNTDTYTDTTDTSNTTTSNQTSGSGYSF